ncbi:MAG TPA: hypothetical protein VMM56_08345 [Planctomycetaceae bacterium]|nr:hypothetical protein [Planctomycetaceae bacterium]
MRYNFLLFILFFTLVMLPPTMSLTMANDETRVESVERPPLERKIEGTDLVEREPLERKLDADKADWNLFARAIERMIGPAAPARERVRPGALLGNADPRLQQYLPALNRVLTIEIHFLRKVADPEPEQLEKIRTAGSAELLVMAGELSRNEHGAFQNKENGARGQLVDVLLKSAGDVLPQDKYERYRAEVRQRDASRIRGACEWMTMHIDHNLSFSVEDYGKVTQILIEQAKPSWSSNLQTFMYRDYCPLPDVSDLEPVLNERQKKIWSGKSRTNSRISFGWPQNIGLDQLGGGVQLEELDDYSQEAADE